MRLIFIGDEGSYVEQENEDGESKNENGVESDETER